MKLRLIHLTLCAAASMTAAHAYDFSFGREYVNPDSLIRLGSGKNNNIEVMMCLDPTAMPVVEAMKGQKLTGMNAWFPCDIERKATARYAVGHPDSVVCEKGVYFDQGWNRVDFDTPVTIGEEPIYIGYSVFETQGSGSHPVAAMPAPAPDGTMWMNIALDGWKDQSRRGTVLLAAAIDGDLPKRQFASATMFDTPLVVAPGQPFAAKLAIKNYSNAPLDRVKVEVGGNAVEIETRLQDFGWGIYDVTPTAGTEQGTDVNYSVTVAEPQNAATSRTSLYVSDRTFPRVPLIEEFTMMQCVNCPFMFYYLEEAIEAYDKPHVYVAHHSGFANSDDFTQPVDPTLHFLFDVGKGTFNPAVMYDRSRLPGNKSIVLSASESSREPYLTNILATELIPALAQVNVAYDGTTATVSGQVNTGSQTTDGRCYVSTYLIEDGIRASLTSHPQMGATISPADDAPADMVEKFRHNGVIRAVLSENTTGDSLVIDADGNFSYTYAIPPVPAECVADNLHVVAFVHRLNPGDVLDNYVLNAGDSKPFAPAALQQVAAAPGLRVCRTPDGSVQVLTPIRSFEVYTADGHKVSAHNAPRGILIVRATLPDGTVKTAKII